MRNQKDDKPARILLLEPETQPSAGRAESLTDAGWQVLQTTQTAELLAAAKSSDVDLVLLHLPVNETIDLDLPAVLRAVAPAAYLPVMIVACSAGERQRCDYLNGGADEVLSDTVSGGELAARVRAMLRIKDLHDRLAASRQSLTDSLEQERALLADLRRRNAYLQTLSTTDPLTKVRNLRSFRDILNHEFQNARRYGDPLSLLMLDVDHFKSINDLHGHPAGDVVLKELAEIFERTIRKSDVVARTGGEEFSIILPKTGRAQARRFAERIRQEVRAHFFVAFGRRIQATVSVGSGSWPDDAKITGPEMLVYFADQALLEAKAAGRDRVVAMHELRMTGRQLSHRQHSVTRADTEQPVSPGGALPVR